MPAPSDTYKASWNELSWEVATCLDAFFAMTATLDWHNRAAEKLQRGEPVQSSPFIASVIVISNSLVTYFFISACRIREQKRSTLNLLQLFSTAKAEGLLSPVDQARADQLIKRTERTYAKLRKARGMAVAHLQEPQNPFKILQTDGVARADVLSYLTDCDALFWLLGTPIGKTHSHDVSTRGAHIADEVERMLKLLWSR